MLNRSPGKTLGDQIWLRRPCGHLSWNLVVFFFVWIYSNLLETWG